jgi:hypothetical protein
VAKLPVWKDGHPVWIDDSGMKPAFAEDPCTCCGNGCDACDWWSIGGVGDPSPHTIVVPDLCMGISPDTYAMTIRTLGAQYCAPSGTTCCGLLAADIGSLQADTCHDTATGITCVAIYLPSSITPEYYEEFSDPGGAIFCGTSGVSVTATAGGCSPAQWN